MFSACINIPLAIVLTHSTQLKEDIICIGKMHSPRPTRHDWIYIFILLAHVFMHVWLMLMMVLLQSTQSESPKQKGTWKVKSVV